jgi:hypothetical protein
MITEPVSPASGFTGRIYVMPYTHADIAWVHTRAWHIDRYVRAMDEVLALYEADPDYHYYIDTWTELIRPYIEHRPNAVEAIRQRVREGRLAVCGGQYGNVRSTAIGNETQIRNMQLGMRRWKELAPDVEFRVHSNIDVTLGHTQMPQLLGLAGIEAYFVMRPLAALDAQDIPRVFHWQGLSGDRILVYRDTGVGLFQEHERFGPEWVSDWHAMVQHLWNTYLSRPAHDGVPAIGLSVGVDDSRPDRFSFNDVPADYGALIRSWNAREGSTMRYGTPDTLIAAVQAEADKLPVIDSILDPTCVYYNIALNGRRGIWWLREQADRLLVDAEIMSALAHVTNGAAYPEADFTRWWEGLLDWTPHAVQWLFREDWQQGELALRNVINAATEQRERAAAALVGGCLPGDATGIALLNTLPQPAQEIMPLWIINGDLTRGFVGLRDAQGNRVPTQVIGFPTVGAETAVLVEANVPGCGTTTLQMEWEAAPSGISYAAAEEHWRKRYGLVEKQPLGGESFTLASDRIRMTLEGGHLVALEDLTTGSLRHAPAGASFLEPVCYPITRTGWSSDAIPDDPQGFVVEETQLDENGPLRWRVTRTGRAGGFWVRQHLDLLKGERVVRSTVQFLDAADEADALLGLSVPLSEEAELSVDIPFGIEPRPVHAIRYGISERAILGLFWGRTWADAKDESGRIALVAADGDKMFRAYGTPRRLTHFLAQKTRSFEASWEAYINTDDVGGRQVFHHLLVLAGSDAPQTDLVRLAERLRHPLTAAYVPDAQREDRSLLSVAPDTVFLSALTWEDGHLLIRLIQMAAEAAEVRIELPFEAVSAELVDFRGRPLSTQVACDGKQAHFSIQPWQVATLRVERK